MLGCPVSTRLAIIIVVGVAVTALWMALRNGGPEPEPYEAPDATELRALLARWHEGNDALDHFDFKGAEAAFREVAERLPDQAAAWANLGIATMNQDNQDAYRRARGHLEKAVSLDPEHLHGNHSLGVLSKHLSDFDRADACFRKVLSIDPHDPTANYYLGTILVAKNQSEQAEALFKKAISAEPHQQSAIYQLFSLYFANDKEDEARPLVSLFQELESAGTGNKAGIVYSEMGRYGAGIRPFPVTLPSTGDRSGGVSYTNEDIMGGGVQPANVPLPGFVPWSAGESAAAAATKFAAGFGPGIAVADVDQDGDLDVWAADGAASGTLFLNDSGEFSKAASTWGLAGGSPSVSGCFGDYDNDGLPDLYISCAGPNRLLRNISGERFEDVTGDTGTGGGDVFTAQSVMADLDADGDVDIYCANMASTKEVAKRNGRWPMDAEPSPNNLFNNDRDGTFTDIAEQTRTAGRQHSAGVLAADLDSDRDADLLVLGHFSPLEAYRNDRIWRFVTVTIPSGLERVVCGGASAADLDADGDLDLCTWRGQARVFHNQGGFRITPGDDTTQHPGCVMDADNDGDLDLFLLDDLRLQTEEGWTNELIPSSLVPYRDIRSSVPADLDDDGVLDVVLGRSGNAPAILRGALDNGNNWLEIGLKGVRETRKMRANTGGIGARVTVVSGTLQQSQDMVTASGVLGSPPPRLHFGLGQRKRADYVSVSWPDDLLQGESKVSANVRKTFTQAYRKSSSCPLLFAWDGERMAFVTDFLGTGGLGFFVQPGVYAPPDPTELVSIPKLAPKDGMWTVSVHEPMEEICFLDEARLMVVDHPEGTVVFPDERIAVNGPAPDGRLIAFRPEDAVFPQGLATREGTADPELIRHADRRYQPGVRPDPRFVGFSSAQEIVVDFGEQLASTKGRPLVLFLDGWVEYPYAHVNFAAWQAGLAFGAISIDVRDRDGRWRVLRDNFGYPAGMPRVMTLDLSELPREGPCQLRLRTQQELYIDRLWLAPDLGAGSLSVRELDPHSAQLRPSGYPREYSPDGRQPLLYDYALMDPAIDYKTMEGDYTRFGDVRELLKAPDDQFVIFGHAEEILLQFKPTADPPAGTTRSFILKTDGYCKDMDLYTAHSSTVTPLPFHGMSGFPYPPGERYPDTAAHREYRARYNTRRLTR